jgi:hypothetical protein
MIGCIDRMRGLVSNEQSIPRLGVKSARKEVWVR